MGEKALEKSGSYFDSEPDVERWEIISSIARIHTVFCCKIRRFSPQLDKNLESVQVREFGNVVGKIGRLGQSAIVRVGSILNW